MAGVGDPPFRRLCRQGGASLVCTEMVSAQALSHNDPTSHRMLRTWPDEHPVSLQIFGSDPRQLAEAARKAEAAGADIVDLNCGCPVPKISKTGSGVALLKEELLFGQCLEAMVKAVKVPVTVKTRPGFVKGDNIAPRFARVAASAGVSAITLHARYLEQRHEGPPDLTALAETVAAVSIPVIGNGGVTSAQEARTMMEKTGCAAVMIGRAAMGHPFIFSELAGGGAPLTGRTTRWKLLLQHLDWMVDYYGEDRGVLRFRKFIPAYLRYFPGASTARAEAMSPKTRLGVVRVLERFRQVWAD